MDNASVGSVENIPEHTAFANGRPESRLRHYLQSSDWKEPSTSIQASFPAVCARERHCFARICLSDGVALLDEPFSALDTLTKTSIHKWYLEIMQHIDLSTLFITHDIDEAILLSDRIYILNGAPGEIRDEIVIKEKKPRAEDFALSDAFLEYKRLIISKL